MNLGIQVVEGGVPALGARAIADAVREPVVTALAQGGIKIDAAKVASECRASGDPSLATASTHEAEKALRAILTKYARNAEKRATMRKVSGSVWYLAAL